MGSAGSWSGHFVQLADSCTNELLSVWSEHQAVSTCRAEKLYFMEMPGPGVQQSGVADVSTLDVRRTPHAVIVV